MSFRDIVAQMTIPPVPLHKLAPPMPPDDNTNSTIICLPVVPRSMRYLKWIMPIAKEDFDSRVMRYVQDMPEIYPTVDEEDRFRIPRCVADRFKRDHQIRLCLDCILEVIGAIIARMDSTTAVHEFDRETDAPLHCGWSNMNWGHPHGSPHRLADVKLVTVAMPMWCFAHKDMADFTAEQQFRNPSSEDKEELQKVSSATRLWARLHDFCYLHDAHYFVVSTYNQWAFGAFSTHWTAAYVSRPISFNATNPNVIQSVLFWMHSSVGHPNGYKVPKVLDESEHDDFSKYRKGKRKARDKDDQDCEWKQMAKRTRTHHKFPKLPDAWKDPRAFFGSVRDDAEPGRSPVREKMHISAYGNFGTSGRLPAPRVEHMDSSSQTTGPLAGRPAPGPQPSTSIIPPYVPLSARAGLPTQLSVLSTDKPQVQAPCTAPLVPPNETEVQDPSGFAIGTLGPGVRAPAPLPSRADADMCASLFSVINLAGSAPAMPFSMPAVLPQPVGETNLPKDDSAVPFTRSTTTIYSGLSTLSLQGGFPAEASGTQF